MKTIHFWHPDGGRPVCGATSTRVRWETDGVTCKRCRNSTAFALACEHVRQWMERDAYDAERRSLMGYDPQEVADRF